MRTLHQRGMATLALAFGLTLASPLAASAQTDQHSGGNPPVLPPIDGPPSFVPNPPTPPFDEVPPAAVLPAEAVKPVEAKPEPAEVLAATAAQPASPAAAALPVTGADILRLLAIAAMLVAGGVVVTRFDTLLPRRRPA